MTTMHAQLPLPGPEPAFADEFDEGDLLLQVSGILPAADFHPFVVAVARRLGLHGWVRHHPAGALVRAVGAEPQLVRLVCAIRDHAPASVRVRGMDPDLVTAATPPVSERFVALVEEPVDWPGPTPDAPAPLARVA